MEAGMPPMVTAAAMAVIAGMESELSVALVGVGVTKRQATLYEAMGVVPPASLQ